MYSPGDHSGHVGDLGNIISKGGKVNQRIISSVQLSGVRSIIGRSIVIHEYEDDLGLTDHPESKNTGNSGSRIGCAIIGVAAF